MIYFTKTDIALWLGALVMVGAILGAGVVGLVWWVL